MNVNDLIGADLDLLEKLTEFGLCGSAVDRLGHYVTLQLIRDSDLELEDLLPELNAESFLARIDVADLEDRVGMDASTIRAVLLVLASAVALFEHE